VIQKDQLLTFSWVFSHTRDAVIVLSSEGKVIEINKAASDLYDIYLKRLKFRCGILPKKLFKFA
jgi:PAS domain-containing protein